MATDKDPARADPPDPPRPRAQLPVFYEVYSKSQSACDLAKQAFDDATLARHARRGVVQGLHAHHAAAPRQPHAVDVGRGIA